MNRRWIFELTGKTGEGDVPIYVGQALDDDDAANQLLEVGRALVDAMPEHGGPARFSELAFRLQCDTTAEQWSTTLKRWVKPGDSVEFVDQVSEEFLRANATCPECGDHYPTHKAGCAVGAKHGLG